MGSDFFDFAPHFAPHFALHGGCVAGGRVYKVRMLKPRGKKGTYYLKRRVPEEFLEFHHAKMVEVSLKTDSLELAREKAAMLWEQYLKGWSDRRDGRSVDAVKRFEAARRIARSHGFAYRPMEDVAGLPLSDILGRIEVSGGASGIVDEDVAAATLGAVTAPALTVTDALDRYWQFTKANVRNKTPNQLRLWENPKKRAIANFVEAVGNLNLADLRPEDMQDFQDWWLDRIEAGAVQAGTANKDFTHFANVTSLVARKLRLGFEPPVRGFRIPEGKQATRPPFSEKWIRTILVPHLVSGDCGLNGQARDIALVMVNTGARLSEVANLTSRTIHLRGVDVPHIEISGLERELKTSASERKIPLVGVSLDAMRRSPNGFPRYVDKAGLSGTLNAYLRENGLLEGDATIYSLRHSFEDRLLAAEVDERVRRDLMGHALGGRQRYGAGMPLGRVAEILAATSV